MSDNQGITPEHLKAQGITPEEYLRTAQSKPIKAEGAEIMCVACSGSGIGASGDISTNCLVCGGVPAPLEADEELDEMLKLLRIPTVDWLAAKTALLAWRDKAVRAELEKLEKHREFIYWGDGSPSDLDSYIKDRLNQLGAKDE